MLTLPDLNLTIFPSIPSLLSDRRSEHVIILSSYNIEIGRGNFDEFCQSTIEVSIKLLHVLWKKSACLMFVPKSSVTRGIRMHTVNPCCSNTRGVRLHTVALAVCCLSNYVCVFQPMSLIAFFSAVILHLLILYHITVTVTINFHSI